MQLHNLISGMNPQPLFTKMDILLIAILNVLLIVVVKLIFINLKALETNTNYWQSTKHFFKLILQNDLKYSDKLVIKNTINSIVNYSSIIGFVERIIYIIAFASNNFELLGIVIAVKTLVRFPEINKRKNATITPEQYILGTLLNIMFAFIITYCFT